MNGWIGLLVALIVGFMLLVQYLALRNAKRARGRPAPDTTAVDGDAYADRRRVYYFFSGHCGQCRAVTPMVDRLRAAHRNLIKVDVSEAPDLARRFGVAATPGFALVADDVIHEVSLGRLGEPQLLSWLERDPR